MCRNTSNKGSDKSNNDYGALHEATFPRLDNVRCKNVPPNGGVNRAARYR